ncbi:MAG: TolC family protein [Candidatus Obscuribacterales bacterium]|nr:TolC family protein [Candidatus Obscuribacterales bacterium]
MRSILQSHKERFAAALLAVLLAPTMLPVVAAESLGTPIVIDGKAPPASVDPDSVHAVNKTLAMDKLRLNSSLKDDSFKTIRLEVQYDQQISLEEALNYAIQNNLAIKISKDSLKYQQYVLYGQVANVLPNLTVAYNLTHTDIMNEKVGSNAKVFLTRLAYPVFQGGSVVYGILGQYYREKGWEQAYKANISDALLDLYTRYNNLLLARVLLQIRAKAVEVSQEQVRVNTIKEAAGTGARFNILQSEAQLASDRQALLQQQVAVRQAALALNFSMNFPMGVNLVPVEETITEQSLFQNQSTIDALVGVALKKRPELREYELFKIAAARNIQVASAPLYPQVSLFQQYSYTNTVSKSSQASSSSDTSGAGVFGGLFRTYQQGLGIVWSLNNMGVTAVSNIAASNSLAHQASVQANQELQTVLQQVRSDYLNWRAAREQIDNAAHGVTASAEELRLAAIRLDQGVGTNLDVITAQHDYVNALTTQAQAIVGSNMAQAQLLHDTGIISSDTLLHGFKGDIN